MNVVHPEASVFQVEKGLKVQLRAFGQRRDVNVFEEPLVDGREGPVVERPFRWHRVQRLTLIGGRF
jgi:hypothetical protein